MGMPPETDKVWLCTGVIVHSYDIQSDPHESEHRNYNFLFSSLYNFNQLCYSSIIQLVNIRIIGGCHIMARGRKSYTLEERLQNVINEINELEDKIKELKKDKKNLEEQVKQERLERLEALIAEKGLSFEEVERMLSE